MNTSSAETIITLLPDVRYFFFTNYQPIGPERIRGRSYDDLFRLLRCPASGDGTLYWISSSLLEEAR